MSALDQQIAQNRAKKNKQILLIVAVILAAVLLTGGVFAFSALFFQAQEATPALHEEALTDKAKGAAKRPLEPSTLRKNLQYALNQAREDLEQILNTTHVAAWNETATVQLSHSLDKAFALYAGSDYAQASQTLALMTKQLTALNNEYQAAYQQSYQQAAAAFSAEQIDNAAIYNNQSLAVNPDHKPAQALQKRIDAYAQVAHWLEQLRIAEIEQNTAKQRHALMQIVKLDPQRTGEQTKLAKIEQQLQQQAFSQALGQAVKEMGDGNLMQAQSWLTKAQQIAPKRAELKTVQARLSALVKQQGGSAAEQQIAVFVQADEWSTVKILAEKSLKAYPQNEKVQQALYQANQIVDANAQLENYLSRPQRLSDSNIRQHAVAAIQKYQDLARRSDKLARRIDKLQQQLKAENQTIQVTLNSDNKTRIRVLGVGVVGKVRSKVLALKPGRYQIEGSRDGYRTEILELDVNKAAQPIKIKLVCSQRI